MFLGTDRLQTELPAVGPVTLAAREAAIASLQQLLGDRLSTAASIREGHGKDASYHPWVPQDAVAFAQSISIRDSAVWAVHDTPNPANCSRLPGDGRHCAAAAPASVSPSDADLPDAQRPHRRTDSADFRPRKQKEPRGLPTPVTRIGR